MTGATDSVPFQVGDDTPAGVHQLVGLDTEHVVPRSRRRPHLGVLQQIRIDEHAQMSLVTEGRHATVGFGNSFSVQAIQRHASRPVQD